MREYDDDSNIQHYAPVLRRIIILVAVITAVPVMLWTITAFMHTYIAQPTIPAPRPLATATAAPASPAADTANPPAPSQAAPAAIDARATDDGRSDRIRDGAGNNAAPNVQVASTAALSPAPSAAPAASPAAVTVQAAPAPSVFPNPPFVTQPAPAASDANNAAIDDLPPPDPITGPVPLPRHRPSVLALADTNIPLPRARPSDAPEPASSTTDAPPSGYDPSIGH
ncbi:MAG TPA: hypothetical protein VK591_00030 [Xanthobacteraceae bacterium]|nr:hypothetical protein [Xanthobacteraceae bacterium]